MGSAIGKHRTSSSCSLAMRIPFSWGSKGDILFPWKENIPLNRVPARCRDQCAAPTALPPPRHKCREALRTGAKPIVPFIYKRQPSCFSTCCGRVLKVNGTVTNIFLDEFTITWRSAICGNDVVESETFLTVACQTNFNSHLL